MSRMVVIGGGYGGLACAARLAKLGHQVTLLERGKTLAGALGAVRQDGFTWDSGASMTLLPAVLRDLFRKSGRSLEAELGAELEPLGVLREHRFVDGSSVQLTGGSRAAQLAAFDELGAGLGQRWLDHVDGYTEVWETLRKEYFEHPWQPDALSNQTAALLSSRETMHRRLRRSFGDERLALVAGHSFIADGHDLRNVPAWVGLNAYLEQCFGGWRAPGGMHRIAEALTSRLETRGVTVLLETAATDLVVRGGRVTAVTTAQGEIDADAVVCVIDPRRLPALASYVVRSMPAIPPVIAHLGLAGTASEIGDLPAELVLHGDPMLVVRTGGAAPRGHTAWTLHGRGKLAEDLLTALARHHIDVRDRVVTRVDRSPRDLVEAWGGSPLGVLWQGRTTVRKRLGPTTPIPGVYAAGAHATPGSGLPFVGLSAALVAQVIGPAG